MNAALCKIRDELDQCGLKTYVVEVAKFEVVAFPYVPPKGRYAGRTFDVGLSLQEADYPEFAPHWIHVTPAIEEKHGRPGRTYDDASGRRWVAFSRTPSDFWDNLPRHDKNMATYLALHIRRFWREA